jgi:hypothetical protein
MRYIITSLLLILSGCIHSNPYLTPKEDNTPTIVDKSAAGTLDRNHDGVVTTSEVETIVDGPDSLHVFIWLIALVLVAVILTMIISRWESLTRMKDADLLQKQKDYQKQKNGNGKKVDVKKEATKKVAVVPPVDTAEDDIEPTLLNE